MRHSSEYVLSTEMTWLPSPYILSSHAGHDSPTQGHGTVGQWIMGGEAKEGPQAICWAMLRRTDHHILAEPAQLPCARVWEAHLWLAAPRGVSSASSLRGLWGFQYFLFEPFKLMGNPRLAFIREWPVMVSWAWLTSPLVSKLLLNSASRSQLLPMMETRIKNVAAAPWLLTAELAGEEIWVLSDWRQTCCKLQHAPPPLCQLLLSQRVGLKLSGCKE